jgi:hypothetical protein
VMLDSVGDGMVYAVAIQTGPPCFTLIRKDLFIPGRCSLAVHGCAFSAGNTTINSQSSTQSLSYFEASLLNLTPDM